MCNCSESEEDVINKEINAIIKQEKELLRGRIKLLLLGTGESGKTTFLKQLKVSFHQLENLFLCVFSASL